jgi:hypothetical protein
VALIHLSVVQALQQSLVQVVAAAVAGIALGLLVVPVVAQVAMLLVAHVLALLVILADILRSKVTRADRRIMPLAQALAAGGAVAQVRLVLMVNLYHLTKAVTGVTVFSGLLRPVRITAAAAAVQAFLLARRQRRLEVLAVAALVLRLSQAQTGAAA